MSRGTMPAAVALGVGGVTLGLLLAWQRERTTEPPAAWPRVVACELDVDLTTPARFRAAARVTFEDVPAGPLHFLLNRSLTIHRAEVEGRPVAVSHGYPLPSRYHGEARVIQVTLEPPPEGAVSLDLEFQGEAEHGTEGSDWRGILYVGKTEARMSEQTVFYPQIPLDLEGPATELAPFRLTVLAPSVWEVFAPLPCLGVEPGEDGKRWRFAGDRPQVLSILAGERRRDAARVAGTEVVTLLRDEHASLAGSFVAESGAALEHLATRFGALDAGSLGVIEITCRSGSSYNWTSEGVIAIDRQALGSVPVPTLAHEVAHLWWGQAVEAVGPGERFLCEGMAEFSAWTYLEDAGRGELVRGAIAEVQRTVATLVDAGASAALEEVGFGHEHYTELAYGKGALVLRLLRGQLLPGVLDRALRQLVAHAGDRPVTVDDFRRVLREAAGLEELQVPWLEGSGDLVLELADLELDEDGGSCQLSIACTPATPRCSVDPRGTPVGVTFGGEGWSERRTVLLTGAETRVRCDTGGRAVTYARLDPDDVWSRPPRVGTVVLDGARLVASDPPAGGRVRFGGQTVRLTFDRVLAPVHVDTLRAVQTGAGGATIHGLSIQDVSAADGGRTLEIRTEPWVPDRRYRVRLTSLTDGGGTPVATAAFEFETPVSDDRTPPKIVASVPAAGATVEPGKIELSVTFDEVMQPSQGFPGSAVRANRRRGLEYPDFADFGTWDESFRTITWIIPEARPGTTYCVPFLGGRFRDLSGNGAADFELTFAVTEGGLAGQEPVR